MQAQYLNISDKPRHTMGSHASLKDFSVTPGETVSAETVCADPALSLYCLDQATQQAIFVELPPEVDLARAPFFYLTQYKRARRLLAVRFDTFRQLARELPAIGQPTPFKAPSILAMKLRTEGTQLMDLFQTSFPQVRNLFSYCDAFGFVR